MEGVFPLRKKNTNTNDYEAERLSNTSNPVAYIIYNLFLKFIPLNLP